MGSRTAGLSEPTMPSGDSFAQWLLSKLTNPLNLCWGPEGSSRLSRGEANWFLAAPFSHRQQDLGRHKVPGVDARWRPDDFCLRGLLLSPTSGVTCRRAPVFLVDDDVASTSVLGCSPFLGLDVRTG